MASRVSPAERLRVEIDEVFAGSGDLAGAVEQVARLGAQLLLQAALEAEVSEFLGRERYVRQAGSDEAREGMRNGYCPTTIKTTAGPVTLDAPEAARNDRTVRLAAVRNGGVAHERVGGVGDRLVRARPVGP